MVEDFARVASDEQGRFVLDVPAAREVTIYCTVENGMGTRQAVVAAGESPSLEILVYFHRGYYGSRAGLSPSDRVLTVDGIDVSSLDESMVGMILDDHEPGVPYTVTVLRDGKPVPVEIRNKPYGR